MIGAMCQVHTKRGSESGGSNLMEKSNQKIEETKREERREKEERRRRKGEKKEWGMKGKKIGCSSSDLPLSDGRNLSDQEVKFVYSMRAMLQEVGIPPPLVYFYPKGCLVGFL